MLKAALDYMMSHPESVVAAVLGVLALFKGQSWVDAQVRESRMRKILSLAHVAFHAVEEAAGAAPDNKPLAGAAKLALFMDKLDQALLAHGELPLSPAERGTAADMASALNRTVGGPQ